MTKKNPSDGFPPEHGDGALGAKSKEEQGKEAATWVRVALMVVILAFGLAGMMGLVMLKKEPAEAKITDRALSVETIVVTPENVPVVVTGLGEVRALDVVPISPQIPGTVVAVHPRLEVGEIIPSGELLFQIDRRDYVAAQEQAAAQVAQLEKSIERLEQQYKIDKERLTTLDRSERLMQEEFNRVKTLYEDDEVGTRSAVDHAEMALNQAADARDQLSQAVSLYPVRINEARSGLDGARAQLALAEANLARTEIRTEFDARIKDVSLEVGQYVSPGMRVLTLADDRILEISVSLDSRDARDWLSFEESEEATTTTAWFGELKSQACKVSWTEDPAAHCWEGFVHRVESFDPKTRTISVAVRVSGEAAKASSGGLPLVEGMFCTVEIPGKTMEQVYRLPRWAVSYEGNVYLARDDRLSIQAVDVIRSEGDETYVRGGLEPGAEVITTRLVNPLPNSLLAVARESKDAQ